MITAEINYWAVLVSVLAVMAIGAVWYSPAAFGRQWAMLSGRMLAKNSSGREMNRTVLAKTVLLTIIMVYTLAHINTGYPLLSLIVAGAILAAWV